MKYEMLGDNSKVELIQFIERVEVKISERKLINEDIKEILAEAEAGGYEKKTIKEMIKLRGLDDGERAELEQLRDIYANALDLV